MELDESDSVPKSGPDLFPHSLVYLAPVSPPVCRMVCQFPGRNRPVHSTRRLAYVSLQGRLVNAQESSSATAIGLHRQDLAAAWELFPPIHRFLIVAIIGYASAESSKNRKIRKLQASLKFRDQLLLSVQQKLDDLSEEVNNIKDQSTTGSKVSVDQSFESPFKESLGSDKIKFMDCGCWLCNQHLHLLPIVADESAVRGSSGHEAVVQTESLVKQADQEECRMSDISDWCSSITSAAEIHLNNLSLDRDMFSLKERREKDTTIKELTSVLQSTKKADSKRILELEDAVRRKNTMIARLKKDLLILEEKVTELARPQRQSVSASASNSTQLPKMIDNLLYDIESITNSSSSDSDSPINRLPHRSIGKLQPNRLKGVVSDSAKTLKSAPTKPSVSLLKDAALSGFVSVPKEISMDQKIGMVSGSRVRRGSVSEDPKRSRRPVNDVHRDVAPSRKRWV